MHPSTQEEVFEIANSMLSKRYFFSREKGEVGHVPTTVSELLSRTLIKYGVVCVTVTPANIAIFKR